MPVGKMGTKPQSKGFNLIHLLLDSVDEAPLDDSLNVLVLVFVCHLKVKTISSIDNYAIM
jgi:hypothetical protein